MKIAIYARVSTEIQEKQETIQSQIYALREFAQGRDWTIIQEYVDDGYSGELLDRPALDKLRDDSRQHLFEAILILSQDRLARKFVYFCLLEEEFKRHGTALIFMNRPESKDTPEEKLLNGVQGVIAEYDKVRILERTRRGRLHKARRGIIVGARAPYGYRYVRDAKNGRYEVVPSEAKTVKMIFDLFVNERLSIRAIARELTSQGIPPQRGIHWRTSSLHRIIRNETYAGVTYYNKNVSIESDKIRGGKYRRMKNNSRRLRARDQWIAIPLPQENHIIDRVQFDQAQKQLIRNSESSPRNVKHDYLLRGLVKCGECDSPLYGTPMHDKLFYRCGNKHRTFPLPRACRARSVKAEQLEALVWNAFCGAIKNPELIINQLPKLKDRQKVESEYLQKLSLIDIDWEALKVEEDRLLDAYRQKIIHLEQLKNQMAKLTQKKDGLSYERREIQFNLAFSSFPVHADKTIEQYCEQIAHRLNKIKNDFQAKRYLLTLALNKIILTGKNVKIRGVVPVDPSSNVSEDAIASTFSGNYGRNTTFEFELLVTL